MIGSAVPDDARQGLGAPSAFFREHEARLVAAARLGPVLDLACGRGRHAIAAADLGLSVVAVDHNAEALAELGRITPRHAGRVETLWADLEAEARPLLESAHFGAILVFRYLHRPLCPWIQSLLAPGGLLLYETFTRDQRELGWGPSCDDFLLEPGELPGLFPELEVELHEEGPSKDERAPRTARLLALRKR
jgi:tellurite methyltransferase